MPAGFHAVSHGLSLPGPNIFFQLFLPLLSSICSLDCFTLRVDGGRGVEAFRRRLSIIPDRTVHICALR